jgi:hypothetical protein
MVLRRVDWSETADNAVAAHVLADEDSLVLRDWRRFGTIVTLRGIH